MLRLQFRVLGPFEVWTGDALVEVSPGRQQALLAALLSRANQVVATEQLVEELWGHRPPAEGRATIYSLVLRLRRLLGDRSGNGAATLLGRQPGYLLRVDDEQVDAYRFERLAAQGHDAVSRSDWRRARSWLDKALDLWRGRPFSGVEAGSIVDGLIRRLDELHGSVLEASIEADLRLGRHVAAIKDARALVADHPFREHAWAQLMFALDRCGRRADALAAYDQVYAALEAELRIVPGAELQRLRTEIAGGHSPELPPRGSEPRRQRHASTAPGMPGRLLDQAT